MYSMDLYIKKKKKIKTKQNELEGNAGEGIESFSQQGSLGKSWTI